MELEICNLEDRRGCKHIIFIIKLKEYILFDENNFGFHNSLKRKIEEGTDKISRKRL